MRKRLCQIFFLMGLVVLFFCIAFGQAKIFEKKETNAVSESETEIPKSDALGTEIFETEASETEISELKPAEEYDPEVRAHFGMYRITEFCSTVYTSRNDHITKQEADMMLGRIVQITPERLVTYGPERGLGTQEGRYCFTNYIVETYSIENPHYGYGKKKYQGESGWNEGLENAVSMEQIKQLEGVITTPQLSEPYGNQRFYTFTDPDILVLYSEVAGEYFLLERCKEEPKAEHHKWDDAEKQNLLAEIYGVYQITRFLPTKFFPFEDHWGEELLNEEADMAVGRNVTISKDLFVTCDNWRMFNYNRPWLAEAEVVNPDYRVKTVWVDEIYGIRDGMLPEGLAQQEYVEIDVYPGYRSEIIDMSLPQMYLVNDGKIILYAMGQYFLLERAEDDKAVKHEKDLSVWLGRYTYTEGDSVYQIEIREKSPGKYEAEIEADVHRVSEEGYVTEWFTRKAAEIYGNNERISFILKEHLEGEGLWNTETVLLRFKRDAETSEIYTYWGMLNCDAMNLDTHDKEAGKICFVRE